MISAIVQARTGSSRLPGKVMMDLCGQPLIHHVVARASKAKLVEKVILATTRDPSDDKLAEWAAVEGIPLYRGEKDNVLERYLGAAEAFSADVIVRVTADDPFKDSSLIDRGISTLLKSGVDFVSNNNPPSYPEGLDVEVFRFGALQRAAREVSDPFEQEHVTQYFYRNAKLFSQLNFSSDEKLPGYRWTIDTKRDFEMAERVYKELYKDGTPFETSSVYSLLAEHPEIAEINIEELRSDMYKGTSSEG